MARFKADVDNTIMKSMENLRLNSEVVFGEMVNAGADTVLRNMRSNMRSSFKTTRSLEAGLGKTRVYKTPSDDGVNVKVGFRGYSPLHKGTGRMKGNGVPIPLIASARDRGSRHGESAKPFFRKSFNKSTIQGAMTAVEPKLFKGVE
jgi:hypothetical protein